MKSSINQKKVKKLKSKFIVGMAIAWALSLPGPAFSQIVPDGNTNTIVNIVDNVTDVTTSTISGVNAFNSFTQFNVNTGNTVNLILPVNTDNLINTISQGVSQIDGILNSIKNSQVGAGNVFLVNPQGIIVGNSGQINVGSLSAITPTQDFVDNFFDSPGVPNEASVTALLNGTSPVNTNAAIINRGKINGSTINLTSGSITNIGMINAKDLHKIVNLEADDINLDENSIIHAGLGKVTINRVTNGDIIISNNGNDVDGLKLSQKELDTIKSCKLNIGNETTTQNIIVNDNLRRNCNLALSAKEGIKTKDIKVGRTLEFLSFGKVKTGNIRVGKDLISKRFNTAFSSKNIYAGNNVKIIHADSIKSERICASNIELIAGGKTTSTVKTGDIYTRQDVINIIGHATETGNIYGKNIKVGGERILETGNIKAKGDINATARELDLGDLTGKNIKFLSESVKVGNIKAYKDISADTDTFFSKNIKTGGNLDISSGNSLDKSMEIITGDIKTGGNVDLAANITETGNIKAGGFVKLTDDNSITTKNICAKDFIELITSQKGDIQTNNLCSCNSIMINVANGNLNTGNINAKQDINISIIDDEQSDSSVTSLKAGKNIDVDVVGEKLATENIKAGEMVSLSASGDTGSTEVITSKDIKAGGPVSLEADTGGTIKTQNISTKSDVIINASNEGVIQTSNINARGIVGVESGGGSAVTTGNICACKGINFDASEAAIGSGNIKTCKDVNLSVFRIGITTGDIKAKGAVTFDVVEGPLETGDIKACKGVSGTADSLGGAEFTSKNIESCATVNIAFGASDNSITTENIKAKGDISLEADTSISTCDLDTPENVTLSSARAIETKQIDAGKNVTGGNITNGNVGKAQSLTTQDINAGENIKLVSDNITTGTITAGGTTELLDDSSIIVNGDINSNDTITLRAGRLTANNLNSSNHINIFADSIELSELKAGNDIYLNKAEHLENVTSLWQAGGKVIITE